MGCCCPSKPKLIPSEIKRPDSNSISSHYRHEKFLPNHHQSSTNGMFASQVSTHKNEDRNFSNPTNRDSHALSNALKSQLGENKFEPPNPSITENQEEKGSTEPEKDNGPDSSLRLRNSEDLPKDSLNLTEGTEENRIFSRFDLSVGINFPEDEEEKEKIPKDKFPIWKWMSESQDDAEDEVKRGTLDMKEVKPKKKFKVGEHYDGGG